MIKPMLFNTDMVRALLSGQKTETRRLVKHTHLIKHPEVQEKKLIEKLCEPPCEPGDVLYVRETWCWCPCWDCGHDLEHGCIETQSGSFYNEKKREYGCYGYKASFADNEDPFDGWRPSIHMPKEAARIFLKVTDVRVERLRECCTDTQVRAEGCSCVTEFLRLWNSTIKPSDIDRYGWAANPWVWVIAFKRCAKPEEICGGGK